MLVLSINHNIHDFAVLLVCACTVVYCVSSFDKFLMQNMQMQTKMQNGVPQCPLNAGATLNICGCLSRLISVAGSSALWALGL